MPLTNLQVSTALAVSLSTYQSSEDQPRIHSSRESDGTIHPTQWISAAGAQRDTPRSGSHALANLNNLETMVVPFGVLPNGRSAVICQFIALARRTIGKFSCRAFPPRSD